MPNSTVSRCLSAYLEAAIFKHAFSQSNRCQPDSNSTVCLCFFAYLKAAVFKLCTQRSQAQAMSKGGVDLQPFQCCQLASIGRGGSKIMHAHPPSHNFHHYCSCVVESQCELSEGTATCKLQGGQVMVKHEDNCQT